jgi:2-polyprenyl-3-methyl-5-hydroxy-6-metoxy-1,4-benzoquinol methylase
MRTTRLGTREERARAFFGSPEKYLASNHRGEIRAEIIADLLGDTRGKRVIDLGCGDGSISKQLSGDLTLVDISPAMIAAAEGRLGRRAQYRCEDIHNIPDEEFDIALCIGVLAHVDDTAPAITAAHRCLKPGGLLVLQLSDRSTIIDRLNSFLVSFSGKLWYRSTRLSDVLDACAGFELLECRRHFLIPAGMQRLLGRALLPVERFVARRDLPARGAGDAMPLLRKHHFTK